MASLTRKEVVNSIILALVVIGLALTVYSAYQYISVESKINELEAQRQKTQELVEQINAGEVADSSQLQGLVLSDVQVRKDLIAYQNTQTLAIRRGGMGLVAIALGWLILDILRSRRRKNESPDPLVM